MRIAVLSDIHSNLVALDAVLAHAGTVDGVWHLGDVVGYGPDPDAVVARLEAVGAVGVRGNHDAAALGGDEIDYFNPEARAAMEWTRRHVTPATLAWLRALPERRTEDEVTLVHGSPRDPTWEYVTSERVARASVAALTTRHGLHGHTHVPVAWLGAGDRRPRRGPRRRRHASPSRPAGRSSTRAASGSRATATRAPATWCSTPWHGPRPGTAWPTTSMPSRPRCAPPDSPTRLAERLYHGV